MPSNHPSLAQLQIAIGGLQSDVQNLSKRLDEKREDDIREQTNYRQHRDSMRLILDAQSEATRALTTTVANLVTNFDLAKPTLEHIMRDNALLLTSVAGLDKRLTALEPPVGEFLRTREQARGAANLLRVFWLGFGTLLGIVATFLAAWWRK